MKRFEIEARFCKTGDMRYISHLDLVRLFQRAVRRAGLPVALSQGYTPHYRISFNRALKLGVESDREIAIFRMERLVSGQEFKERLNEKLPEGVKVLECRKKF
jgi:radical SAM-linked protein